MRNSIKRQLKRSQIGRKVLACLIATNYQTTTFDSAVAQTKVPNSASVRNCVSPDTSAIDAAHQNQLFTKASWLRNGGKFQEAAAIYKQLLNLPDFEYKEKALIALAEIQLFLGKMHETETVLNQCIRQFPKSGEALLLRSELYGWLGNTKKSIADLKKAMRVSPGIIAGRDDVVFTQLFLAQSRAGDLDSCSALAELQLATGRQKQVLSLIDKRLKNNPKDPYALEYKLCIMYQYSISIEERLSISKKLVQLNRERYKQYRILAEVEAAVDKADYIKAHKVLEPLKAIHAQRYWLAKARMYRWASDFKNALLCVDKTLTLSPDDWFVHDLKARCLAGLFRWNESILECSKALTIKGSPRARILAQRAKYNGYLGHYQEALRDCNTALLEDPYYSFSYLQKGRILADQGKLAEALSSINKQLELERYPEDKFSGYLYRAKLNRKLGKYMIAKQDLENALLEYKRLPGNLRTQQRMDFYQSELQRLSQINNND